MKALGVAVRRQRIDRYHDARVEPTPCASVRATCGRRLWWWGAVALSTFLLGALQPLLLTTAPTRFNTRAVHAKAQSQSSGVGSVPYISQGYCYNWCPRHNWNGHNNCGPASLAMVVDANGRRPNGLTNRDFVAHAREYMADEPDRCSNPPTTRADLDRGSARYGLCHRGEAWSLAAIRALTDQCLPVIVFVEPTMLPLSQPGWFGRLDHIMVVTNVDDTQTTFHDPLDFRGTCTPSICDPNALCGRGNSRVSNALMRDALFAADNGWWGKAYGNAVGDCDLPDCGSASGDGGAGGTVPPGEPLDEVRVRMSSLCAVDEVQMYWEADDDSGFSEARSQIQFVSRDWSTVTIYMDPYESWRGELRRLRIDPMSNEPGCIAGISYIWVTNRFDDPGKIWTFYDKAGPGRGCPLRGWECQGLRDLYQTGAWIVQATGNDPWIAHHDVGLDLRR